MNDGSRASSLPPSSSSSSITSWENDHEDAASHPLISAKEKKSERIFSYDPTSTVLGDELQSISPFNINEGKWGEHSFFSSREEGDGGRRGKRESKKSFFFSKKSNTKPAPPAPAGKEIFDRIYKEEEEEEEEIDLDNSSLNRERNASRRKNLEEKLGRQVVKNVNYPGWIDPKAFDRIFLILWCLISGSFAANFTFWVPSYRVWQIDVSAMSLNVLGSGIVAVMTAFEQVKFQYLQTYLAMDAMKRSFCSVFTSFGNFIEDSDILLSFRFGYIRASLNICLTLFLSIVMYQICRLLAIKYKTGAQFSFSLILMENVDKRMEFETTREIFLSEKKSSGPTEIERDKEERGTAEEEASQVEGDSDSNNNNNNIKNNDNHNSHGNTDYRYNNRSNSTDVSSTRSEIQRLFDQNDAKSSPNSPLPGQTRLYYPALSKGKLLKDLATHVEIQKSKVCCFKLPAFNEAKL